MRLDKLEIHGFKSFKDKTVLEFPDQFTVIVGPNGSGKSNIIDSICFVLGRSRGLRADNLTELICNGGINGEPLDRAKVTMYLSNGTEEHIKISREIDRGGKSVYKRDDKRTTREEILSIVGDNEYNIILQDDITRVIEMRPKERREIIDDLCGIAEYDKKKEKAMNELQKVESRISETHIILGEKQGYLEGLKRERDDALRYQKLENELKQCNATVMHLNITDHEKKLERIHEKLGKIKREREGILDKIKEIKTKILEKEQKLKGINTEILNLEKEKGGTRITELRGEIIRNQDKMENISRYVNDIEREISEKKIKKQKLEDEQRGLNSELTKLSKKVNELQLKIKKESERVESHESEKKVDELKNKIFDLRSRINFNIEITEKDKIEIKELEDERDEIEGRINELLKKEQILARMIDDRSMENKSNFDEFERLKSELPKIIQKQFKIQKDLKELQIELAKKRAEIKTIEKTTHGLNRAVSTVLSLKPVISGIHGTVAQLGCASKPEYEMALQVAASGRMQNIVVDNEDTASKCIQYLRKKQIGRCTFLPLTKINVNIEDKPPGNAIGFARDFITTPYKFKKVFEYVFGNTLLVKDSKSAKSIGIGKWRMVTPDGDLFESSGAITGGYLRRIAIRFSSTDEIEKEVSNLEKRIIEVDSDQQELEFKKIKIEERLSKLEKPVASGKTDIERIRMDKDVITDRRNELKMQVNEINKKIEELGKEISKSKSRTRDMQNEIKAYEERLDRLLRGRKTTDLSELEMLKDEHRNLEIEKNRVSEKNELILQQISELKEELKDLSKQKGRIEEEITETKNMKLKLEEELIRTEKENTALIDKIDSLTDKRLKVEKRITELGTEIGRLDHELDSINEKSERMQIEQAKTETRLSDLTHEFNENFKGVEIIDKQVNELEERINAIESELSTFGSINIKSIETYEVIKKEFDNIAEKLETLKNERSSIFDFMQNVEMKKKKVFMKTFEVVKESFEEIFKKLSKGHGTLTLDKPEDISNSGLLITASPKGKKLMSLDAMSGGEKVLTSSAFLLAIQQYKPSYFYIVDEMDAALDKENSMRLAELLKNSTAQFMLITHNDQVMKQAHSVIGVSMNKGLSSVVGVKLT